jgi:predicted dehydrogenase
MAEVRVGIAGYGTVGRIRRRYIDEHPQLRAVAVCDQGFAEPATLEGGVRAWPNAKKLLANEELDALFVCLPNYLAPDVTVAGLERSLHVFCEKPPGRDLSDIVRVREIERRHPGQRLMYGFNHRYHDSVRQAQRLIRDGELGEVIDLRGVYGKSAIIRFSPEEWRSQRALSGGGILLDQGIHMVDMMRLFAGELDVLDAVISNRHHGHDVEDNAYALMRNRDGAVAMLHSSATQWRHRFQLDITLTRGAISLAGILSSTRSYGAETITVAYPEAGQHGDPREVMTRYNHDPSWHDEVFDFAAAILEDRDIEHGSSLEALKTMELVYRIYCADREWAKRFGLSADIPAEAWS